MCLLCLDGLHIPSRWAHLVLDGELGERESIRHDDMFFVGSMKNGVCVCFWPPVKDELLLSMRFQSLVLTSMTSPPYPRPQ